MKGRGIILGNDIKREYVHGVEGVVFAVFPPFQGRGKVLQLEFTAEAAEKLGQFLIDAASESRPSEDEGDGMMTWPAQLQGGGK